MRIFLDQVATIRLYDSSDNLIFEQETDETDDFVRYYNRYVYSPDGDDTYTEDVVTVDEPFKIIVEKVGYQDYVASGIEVIAGQPTIVRAVLIREPLEITAIDTTNISKVGLSDGQIEVTATGGDGSYEYSIDNVNWQVSNTFTGLAAGTYTVYVRDGQTEPFTDSFQVKLFPTSITGDVFKSKLKDKKIEGSVKQDIMTAKITKPDKITAKLKDV